MDNTDINFLTEDEQLQRAIAQSVKDKEETNRISKEKNESTREDRMRLLHKQEADYRKALAMDKKREEQQAEQTRVADEKKKDAQLKKEVALAKIKQERDKLVKERLHLEERFVKIDTKQEEINAMEELNLVRRMHELDFEIKSKINNRQWKATQKMIQQIRAKGK
jgi:hypothetical protein